MTKEGDPGTVFIIVPECGQLEGDIGLDDAMEEMI